MTLRLYLDEDVIPLAAQLLRERGIDAVSVHDVSALGLTDHEQLRRATEDARTLVTFNYHDFNALAANFGRELAV